MREQQQVGHRVATQAKAEKDWREIVIPAVNRELSLLSIEG